MSKLIFYIGDIYSMLFVYLFLFSVSLAHIEHGIASLRLLNIRLKWSLRSNVLIYVFHSLGNVIHLIPYMKSKINITTRYFNVVFINYASHFLFEFLKWFMAWLHFCFHFTSCNGSRVMCKKAERTLPI